MLISIWNCVEVWHRPGKRTARHPLPERSMWCARLGVGALPRAEKSTPLVLAPYTSLSSLPALLPTESTYSAAAVFPRLRVQPIRAGGWLPLRFWLRVSMKSDKTQEESKGFTEPRRAGLCFFVLLCLGSNILGAGGKPHSSDVIEAESERKPCLRWVA